ncbi:MAG: MBL fold metallo-hydrolase [Dehalococcoidia bacterium]
MSRGQELLFLGSGNAFASGRYWSSFLLNGRFLFDASPIALPHLKQSGIAPQDVDAVFISHFHADHFFGLPFLLLEYAHQGRDKPFTMLGPPGIEQRMAMVVEAGYPHLLETPISYDETYVDLRDGLQGEVAGLKYLARSVLHVDDFPCFGFRVELDGQVVAYSGDSMMCDALFELGDGADTFVVECSCWEAGCGPHMGPDEVRELRKKLGPKPRFILTHLDAGEHDLGIENTVVAQDFARYSL